MEHAKLRSRLPSVTKERLEKIRRIVEQQRLQQQQAVKPKLVAKKVVEDDSDRIRIYYDLPYMWNGFNFDDIGQARRSHPKIVERRQVEKEERQESKKPRSINPITFTRKIIDLRHRIAQSSSDSNESIPSSSSSSTSSLENLEPYPTRKVIPVPKILHELPKHQNVLKLTKLIEPVVDDSPSSPSSPELPESTKFESLQVNQNASRQLAALPPATASNAEQTRPKTTNLSLMSGIAQSKVTTTNNNKQRQVPNQLVMTEIKSSGERPDHCHHATSHPYTRQEIRRYMIEKRHRQQQQKQIEQLEARLLKEKVAENRRKLQERLDNLRLGRNHVQNVQTLPKSLVEEEEETQDVPDQVERVETACDRATEMSFYNLRRPDTEGAESVVEDKSSGSHSSRDLELAEFLVKFLEDRGEERDIDANLMADDFEEEYLQLPVQMRKKKKERQLEKVEFQGEDRQAEVRQVEDRQVEDRQKHSLIIQQTTTMSMKLNSKATLPSAKDKLRRLYAHSEQLLQESNSLIQVATSRSHLFGSMEYYPHQEKEKQVESNVDDEEQMEEEVHENDQNLIKEIEEDQIEEEEEEGEDEENLEDYSQPALIDSPRSPISPNFCLDLAVPAADDGAAARPKLVPDWSELRERILQQSTPSTNSSVSSTSSLLSSPLDAVYPKSTSIRHHQHHHPNGGQNAKFIEFYNAPTAAEVTPPSAPLVIEPVAATAVTMADNLPNMIANSEQFHVQQPMSIVSPPEIELEYVANIDLAEFIKAQARRIYLLRKDCQLLERTNQRLNISLPLLISRLELNQVATPTPSAFKAFLFDLVKEVITERFNFDEALSQPLTSLLLPLKMHRRRWPSQADRFSQTVLDLVRAEFGTLFETSQGAEESAIEVLAPLTHRNVDPPEVKRDKLGRLGLVAYCRHQWKLDTVDGILWRELLDDEFRWVGSFRPEVEEIRARLC